MRPCLALLLAPVLLLSSIRCSSPVAGGSTTETTNTVVAVAVSSSGAPVAGALAKLRPAGYLVSHFPGDGSRPPSIRDLETDRNGRIRLDSLPDGDYVLELNDRVGEAALVRFGIPGDGRHLDLGSRALAPYAEIRGTVVSDVSAGRVRVELFGLERQVLVDPATGRFSLPGTPAGNLRMRAFTESEEHGVHEQDVPALEPAERRELDTIVLTAWALEDYGRWSHFRDIRINTTPAGAGVAGTFAGFPLPIRLDSGNFDFRQARPDGQDLRFATPDGTKLPYQISDWDPITGRASIWVRADTVRGNDSLQTVRMHWGMSRALNFSNGSRVFAPADGYAGVWHLDSSTADASDNRLHGEAEGSGSQMGLLGLAASFDGSDALIRIRNRPALEFGTGDFTASVWVRLDRLGVKHQLFCKRDLFGGHFEMQVMPDGKAKFHFRRLDSASFLESKGVLTAGAWHHLAVTRSGGIGSLFLDGKLEATLGLADNVNSTSDLLLGQDPDEPEPLFGNLDELQLLRASRTPEWVKLQFESQRPGSALLRFR